MTRFKLHKGLGKILLVSSFALACSPAANALIINTNFIGGSAPSGGGSVAGGGTLQSVFNAAAGVWESMIGDAHVVDIDYGWDSLSGGTLGVHQLTGQGGVPNRETSALIRFDNDTFDFYLDDTPLDNSEWSTETITSADLGGGSMITGRQYTGAGGLADGRFDLFTIALHEIGHALGLSSANFAFQAENVDLDIDIISGPYAGAVLGTQNGAHLSINEALMYPFAAPGTRTLISEADLWANCSVSQFTDCNLTPRNVSEPGILFMLGFGTLLMGIFTRRKTVKTV